MPKNILIFSDGTGQSGGLTPDEARSNIYKLYRATRCGPENNIDPDKQLAFYDPGLGSAGDGGGYKFSWMRKIYNILSGATGLGITRNIIDCYAAIIRMYEPGDRIYLFGFSRGAYTARCVGGVLGYCGVPTKMKDGSPLKRDPATATAIATEGVKRVYQHGASIKNDPKKQERLKKAAEFRKAYGSEENALSNAYPFFIGVFDTVATLGAGTIPLIVLSIFSFVILTTTLSYLWPYMASLLTFLPQEVSLLQSAFAVLCSLAAGYLFLSLRYGQFMDLKRYRMAFYDTKLNPHVSYARHAISIDENRDHFSRVAWDEEGAADLDKNTDGPERFKQIWFAGVHSDIGGSYIEPESRLSDISLKWMVEEALSLPHPILVDQRFLRMSPSATGMQHDERQSTLAAWPKWAVKLLLMILPEKLLGWPEGFREVPEDAPLHPSVVERFKASQVLHYGDHKPYRPCSLREHIEVRDYYEKK